LAVCGTNKFIVKRDYGNFLSTNELISRYDKTVREYVEGYKKDAELYLYF